MGETIVRADLHEEKLGAGLFGARQPPHHQRVQTVAFCGPCYHEPRLRERNTTTSRCDLSVTVENVEKIGHSPVGLGYQKQRLNPGNTPEKRVTTTTLLL